MRDRRSTSRRVRWDGVARHRVGGPLRRIGSMAAVVVTAVAVGTAPALACGGLVGENGTIELVRTTTLAAYSDGIERYVTSFEFTGEGREVGSIVPLPDVPTKVERGGDWTLQRLSQEIDPRRRLETTAGASDVAADGVEVVMEVEIDALDITVLEGGGDAVGEWAVDHGFLLTPDAPEVLDFYAERSPVFMAARFDAERADDLGQQAGDSTPIMATIPTDDPWVPIRILGLGADPDERIEADVFLLTEHEPDLLAGGPGLTLDRSEPAGDALLADLRSDEGMGWVPDGMWLTYLGVDSPAGWLDYDLAVSATPGSPAELADTGVAAPVSLEPLPVGGENASTEGDTPRWPLYAGAGAGLLVLGIGLGRRRRPEEDPS